MTEEAMRELAQKTTDLLLSRIQTLPQQPAWYGEFRLELSSRFDEDPPEESAPALEILEKAAKEIMPISSV